MLPKFLASIVLITLSVAIALSLRSTPIKSQSREPANIKVVINQLAVKDGVIPIEIVDPILSSSAPNVLEDFTYNVRNNSARAISALAVRKTITYEDAGSLYIHSVYSMMDNALHPDLVGANLLQPGSQAPMESAGPLKFKEGVVIKEIRLTVDYALFDDNTAYGSGREGERRIVAMRDGAREYKRWLTQKYSRGGKSLTTILPLMQSSGVPEELKLNIDQILGADRYRLYVLRTLQTKGAADVERVLQRRNSQLKGEN